MDQTSVVEQDSSGNIVRAWNCSELKGDGGTIILRDAMPMRMGWPTRPNDQTDDVIVMVLEPGHSLHIALPPKPEPAPALCLGTAYHDQGRRQVQCRKVKPDPKVFHQHQDGAYFWHESELQTFYPGPIAVESKPRPTPPSDADLSGDYSREDM